MFTFFFGDWTFNIIEQFHDIISLQQIFGVIDGLQLEKKIETK
jgi:hypothetical protein